MKIPKKIKLLGKTITVEWDKELSKNNDNVGEANYRYDKIVIQPNVKGYPRTQQDIELTFFHELVHWILNTMEESELRGNEKFVELFSQILYQVLKDNRIGFTK